MSKHDAMAKYSGLTAEKLKAVLTDLTYGEPIIDKEIEEYWNKFEQDFPLVDAPESWESNYRKKLEAEIEPGIYTIGEPGIMVAQTGKGGYINYLVALMKKLKRYK